MSWTLGENFENLVLLDYVAWETVPDMLGAADVMLVLLEPDAGTFSAPSKTLTYLAAGRPIVGAMPLENLASRMVNESGAGVVVGPGDYAAFSDAVAAVLADRERAEAMARAARDYAERHFDIERIADEFIASVTR